MGIDGKHWKMVIGNLVDIGDKAARHGRNVMFQLADLAVRKNYSGNS